MIPFANVDVDSQCSNICQLFGVYINGIRFQCLLPGGRQLACSGIWVLNFIYYRACNGIQHKAASSVPIKSPASGQVSKALKEPSLSSLRPPLMLFAEMSPALESEIANMGFAGETIFYLLIFFTA